jgi:hypothetical protein
VKRSKQTQTGTQGSTKPIQVPAWEKEVIMIFVSYFCDFLKKKKTDNRGYLPLFVGVYDCDNVCCYLLVMQY